MNRKVMRIVSVAAAGIALSTSGLAGAGAAGAAQAISSGASASLPVYGFLNGVAATSARNAWAVGDINFSQSLILHWNGTAWKRVPSPSPPGAQLHGVAATSATNAWAVGQTDTATLILHWNGTAWTRVPSPSPASDTSYLWGVAATARTAWTVGAAYRSGVPRTLILHWNSAAWK